MNRTVSMGQTMAGWAIHWRNQVGDDGVVR